MHPDTPDTTEQPATEDVPVVPTLTGEPVPPAPEEPPVEPEVEPEVEPTPEDPAEPVERTELSNDELVALRSLPTAQHATDAQGTTRIVVPDLNVSGWQPAPLEPDAAEVARLENLQAAIVEQDKARAEALGLTGR